MVLSRTLFTLTAFLLSLVQLNPRDLRAQELTDAPIIALVYNEVYAISPRDGETRLLVKRSEEQQERLKASGVNDYITLSTISPDNTKIAYTTPVYEQVDPAFEDYRTAISRINPKDITLVDIASGEQTPITDQGANFADVFDHDKLTVFYGLTWSMDSQRLYFVTTVQSMRNRVPQNTIEYYDLETGERHVLARITQQVWNIQLYGVAEGVIALIRLTNTNIPELRLYGLDGSVINSVPRPVREPLDHSDSINPILKDGAYYFGYHPVGTTGSSPALLNVATGEKILLNEGMYPAFMSHTYAESSLHLALAPNPFADNWKVTDPEGTIISTMTEHLEHLYYPSDMAFSPEGQSIAFFDYTHAGGFSGNFSDPAPIVVMDETGTRKLNFKAHKMMWGAIDFTYAPVILPAETPD